VEDLHLHGCIRRDTVALMAAPLLKTCCRSDDAAVPPSVLVVSVVVVFALQFTVPVGVTIHTAFAFRGTAAATAAPINAASNEQRFRRIDILEAPNFWPPQAPATDATDTGVKRAQPLGAVTTAFTLRKTLPMHVGPFTRPRRAIGLAVLAMARLFIPFVIEPQAPATDNANAWVC
jgi:hypothetical protein